MSAAGSQFIQLGLGGGLSEAELFFIVLSQSLQRLVRGRYFSFPFFSGETSTEKLRVKGVSGS